MLLSKIRLPPTASALGALPDRDTGPAPGHCGAPAPPCPRLPRSCCGRSPPPGRHQGCMGSGPSCRFGKRGKSHRIPGTPLHHTQRRSPRPPALDQKEPCQPRPRPGLLLASPRLPSVCGCGSWPLTPTHLSPPVLSTQVPWEYFQNLLYKNHLSEQTVLPRN